MAFNYRVLFHVTWIFTKATNIQNIRLQPHWTQYTNEHFTGRWTSLGGPQNWPPQLPDFNPPGFHVWAHMKYLYCFWYSGRQHNKYFKINQSNCLHWFYLITATRFGPYFGPSLGSFIKYVSLYWNILIWIHINVNHYNYHNTYNYYWIVKRVLTFKFCQNYLILTP
jgi:hypothetical protein